MHLVKRRLAGRAFLLQFMELMREFGQVIPWLEPLRTVGYYTNGVYFRDSIMRSLDCREPDEVTPYQFVTSDVSREYIGGILHFARSPEVFVDCGNQALMEQLVAEGFQYITCLQVRNVLRGQGHGTAIMRRALKSILATHNKVWGAVSNPRLLPWYAHLGAHVRSGTHNEDKLWIVSWE